MTLLDVALVRWMRVQLSDVAIRELVAVTIVLARARD